MQAFPGQDLEQLWERHEESRSEFVRVFGDPNVPQDGFEGLVLGALKRQAAYVQSIPFWQLRGPWWFFVERDRKKDRLASEAYDLEWIATNVGTGEAPNAAASAGHGSSSPSSTSMAKGDVSEAAQRRHA